MINPTERFAAPMRHTLRMGIAAFLIGFSGAAPAQTMSDFVVVDDVTVYLAVLPAEMLRSFPSGSEESRMHGGVPGGRHVHHVQVALFDAKSGERIIDAQVVATVTEAGLAGTRRTLEPFTIGDAETYGGYFELQPRQHYEVRIRAELPGDERVIEQTFDYEHQ